jgi:GAF domain-containing protein
VRFLDVASDVATNLTAGTTYPLKDSATGWVKEHRRTNIETDFVQKRQFPIDEIQLKSGLRSAIRVPLFAQDEVFGTINLTSSKPNIYGEEAKEVLEQLSAQVAGAIENARLYQLEREQRLQLETRVQSLQSVVGELKSALNSVTVSARLLMETLKDKSPQGIEPIQNILHELHSLESKLEGI